MQERKKERKRERERKKERKKERKTVLFKKEKMKLEGVICKKE